MAKQQRDPAKEAFWREVLKRYATSGLSVREFCHREQLTESAFHAWRRTIGERESNSRPAFVPAVINGEAEHEPPFVLKLAGGIRLQLPPAIPATRLADVVRALETRAES